MRDVKESFWGDLYRQARRKLEEVLNKESVRLRDEAVDCEVRKQKPTRRGQRNGFYFRDFVSRFGTLRLKVARTREESFLPGGLERFQRRAAAVMLLIREAFLRGLSTRQVGRVVAILTDEVVSAQTVSKLTRSLDHLVKAFHQARLRDEWAYLFLDGVSLRVRRPGGRKRVQMLVAYGVRADGSRRLLAFLRSPGESQAAWESLLQDLYRRGLEGKNLLLIVTDGCAGLAAATQTVYPRVAHQRCWVHKMRNTCEAVRRRDHDQVKHEAQKIHQAARRAEAERAFLRFKWNWQRVYPAMVGRLERDLPERLTFFRFPPHLWSKLRTTKAIERYFVEVRRRTRPMVCVVNVESVDRIIYAIRNGLNDQWRTRTLPGVPLESFDEFQLTRPEKPYQGTLANPSLQVPPDRMNCVFRTLERLNKGTPLSPALRESASHRLRARRLPSPAFGPSRRCAAFHDCSDTARWRAGVGRLAFFSYPHRE